MNRPKKFDFAAWLAFNSESDQVMFGFVKKIFHRSETSDAPAAVESPNLQNAGGSGSQSVSADNQEIALPLKDLLEHLTESARSLIQGAPNSDVFIFLPRARITGQLAKGKVELLFGEIRKTSPQGVFAGDASCDEEVIIIPFPLIIQRLKAKNPPKESSKLGAITPISESKKTEPASAQSQPTKVEPESTTSTKQGSPADFAPPPPPAAGSVPPPGTGSMPPPSSGGGVPVSPIAASFDDDDIPDIFPGVGGGSPTKEAKDDAPFAVPPPPAAPKEADKQDKPISFGGKDFSAPKGPISPIASEPDEAESALAPPSPPPPSAPAGKLDFGSGSGDEFSFAPPPPPGAYSSPPPPPAPASAQVAPAAPSESMGGATADTLEFPVNQMWDKWPEAVKEGLSDHQSSSLQIPVAELTPILQRGKAVFPWSEVRHWLRPKAKPTLLAQEEKTELVFPMGILVPAYMKSQQSGKNRQQVDTKEMDSIPDLFGGAPPPSTPPPSASAGVSASNNDTQGDLKAPAGQVGGGMSPLQLVQEALNFSEVIGAFLASSDGLLIHGDLPNEMKQETFAAFIPQMYDRVAKYTKELRQGELNYLSLAIGETGMLILKAEDMYFAALSKSKDTLPLDALGQLVSKLKTK